MPLLASQTNIEQRPMIWSESLIASGPGPDISFRARPIRATRYYAPHSTGVQINSSFALAAGTGLRSGTDEAVQLVSGPRSAAAGSCKSGRSAHGAVAVGLDVCA